MDWGSLREQLAAHVTRFRIDAEAGEDLVQRAMEKTARKLVAGQLQSMQRYAHRVLRNLCLDYLRHSARVSGRELSLELLTEQAERRGHSGLAELGQVAGPEAQALEAEGEAERATLREDYFARILIAQQKPNGGREVGRLRAAYRVAIRGTY